MTLNGQVEKHICVLTLTEFRKVVDTKADAFQPIQVLWQLNEELAYIKDLGSVLEIPTGLLHRRKDSLVNLSFANREYNQTDATKDGTKITAKNAAAEWLKWEKRRVHNAFAYRPGEDAVVGDNILRVGM